MVFVFLFPLQADCSSLGENYEATLIVHRERPIKIIIFAYDSTSCQERTIVSKFNRLFTVLNLRLRCFQSSKTLTDLRSPFPLLPNIAHLWARLAKSHRPHTERYINFILIILDDKTKKES